MNAKVAVCLTALCLLGCGSVPESRASTAATAPELPLKQLMEWVIDPAADVVWESVKSISTDQGTKEIAPDTEEQWDAVRNAAAVLIETGASLTAEGRARGGDDWTRAARRLVDAARDALKAAQGKDAAAVFDAGGRIYNACAGCHHQYAPQLNAYASPR